MNDPIGLGGRTRLAIWFLLGCTAAWPQADSTQATPSTAVSRPAFEVASVKVTSPDEVRLPASRRVENGRLTIRRQTLPTIISYAYDVLPFYMQIPAWMQAADAPRFDIDAKGDGPASVAQMKLMLQMLLEDRLKLKVHHAMIEGVHQAIRVGKSGSKLKDAAPSGAQPERMVTLDREHLRDVFRAAPIEALVYHLSNFGGGTIYDQTGLTGKYDFVLDYGRYLDGPVTINAIAAAREEAVRTQLGLEIVEAKFPVDTLVIDSAERAPIGN